MITETRTQDIETVRTLFHDHFHGPGHDTMPKIHAIGDRYGYRGKILSRRATHPTATTQTLDELIQHIAKG